ncbi:polar amino acid transport system substrate-binding protein [Inhella inkyongensis]|uniref:Polar amino acid transport system substrate-binding protein n=1 Tax=Inhella inkyongensis TaxID=392593 RepID=A0A840S205_9BURK|nr:transporter substrate-binding domain-containing protein [Inhella inkyongensis]MBB5205197.1 polar amino acid transport system substrate-binding protein [Inhella inkyongensis]
MSWLVGLPCVAQTSMPPCPQPLRVAFLNWDSPPLLMGNGAEFADPPGLAVELTRQVLARMGCSPVFSRAPLRRLHRDLELGELDLVVGIGHSSERAQHLAFPLRSDGSLNARLALAQAPVVLLVRQEAQTRPRWDGQKLLPRGARIGVIQGSIEETLAEQQGWTLERSPHREASLTKLRRGLIDAVLTNLFSVSKAEREREPALVVLEPPLHRALYFAPVRPALLKEHPAFVEAFWLRLCQAARSALAPQQPCQ